MSASTCEPPRPALMSTGPPSGPFRRSCFNRARSISAPRVRRERQERNKDVGAGEKRTQAVTPGKRLHAWDRFHASATSRARGNPKRRRASAALLPMIPSPMMPTLTSRALRIVRLPPDMPALLPAVDRPAAQMVEHLPDHVFRHPRGEVGIDDPDQRHGGQSREGEHMVDAGAEREDDAQVLQTIERLLPRFPNERVVRVVESLGGLRKSAFEIRGEDRAARQERA